MGLFKDGSQKKKSKSGLHFSKAMTIPKTAQDTIPFLEVYDNGIFLVGENTYTLIFAFDNLDYSLLRDEEQLETYERYQKLLNALPSDVAYQEFIMNSSVNTSRLESVLVPQSAVYGHDLHEDYCNIVRDNIRQAEQASSDKIMVIALAFTPTNKMDNVNTLFKYYRELQGYFTAFGSDTRQLNPEDVFKILYDFYHPFDDAEFLLPANIFSKGGRVKDYIAPSMFAFKNKEIEIGGSFTRVFFVKKYDRDINDEFICDLLDNNCKVTVSKQIQRIEKSEALEQVRKEIFDLQGRIQARKEKNHKRGGDFIPFRLTERLTELEDLQTRLSDTTCELFEIGIFISVSAKSLHELDELSKALQDKSRRHQVTIDILARQQEKAMNSVLPFGINHFNQKSGNSVSTYLLSDAAAVLIPFSYRTYFSESGICYGLNKVTNAMIVLDRTNEMNANGFTLGASGSGKSMQTKAEVTDVRMKFPSDEIIIIDPENEYLPLIPYFNGERIKLSADSPTKMNIFDTDLNYSEDGSSAIALKSEFLMTVVETAKGVPLTSAESSIIDRCIKEVYQDFVKSGGDKSKLPTLRDFYELLCNQEQQEARDIALSLELYAKGSFNTFAEKTNVEINKKFLVIDIFEMGEQMKSVGLQVILEFVWQRVIENKNRGVRTWVWIDEFSMMFTDGGGRRTSQSGDFFAKVYKRIRKHGGVVTGITQNITEVLASPQAQTMISNSEFVVLLQQKKSDLERLIELFELSPSQAAFLKTGDRGTGLIVCGKKVIPFAKIIPQSSLMYQICSTNFKEIQEKNREESQNRI
jgi:hypothetical protein